MTVPPDEGRAAGAPDEPPLDFDPYRFGKPDQPVPPEYAPPGYVPPQPQQPQVLPPPPYPYPTSRPPYGYPYPPPQYGVPPGAHSTGNTKAVISLVLGILALLLFWASFWDLALIVPAIVLGAIGRNDAQRDPRRGGRGMATSGLICGIVALVLAVVATIYIYNRIKPCLDEYGTSTSSSFQKCASDRLLGNDG